MFKQVILKSVPGVKKRINRVKCPSLLETSEPVSLYEVNIRSLKNIVESIRKIKNK